MVAYTEAPSGGTADNGDKPLLARTEGPESPGLDNGDKPLLARGGDVLSPAIDNGDKPILTRPGRPEASALTNGDKPILTRGGDVTDPVEGLGIIIPAAFNAVDVKVVDPEGNRLPKVDWVMSAGTFPTAAKVDANAEGTLFLLKSTYTKFMGVAERSDDGETGVDYTWYNPADDGQEPINPVNTDSAEIVLEPQEIKGFYVGDGADFGGMLG